MPAGYIDGGEGDDNQYILKIGDAFDNVDVLKSMVLCSIDGIGDVRLSDVADIELTDNADDSYAKVGKNRAVLLSIYKSSTASTSSVSNASTAAMKELMAENDGLHLTTIMDQGDYIKLIVNSVMSNLIEGAVLAIIVLALFLKDIRPTLVVAISMPLSVLFAIVMMYFSGITLNILSLSGLGLGVGMLVDNSVVVIENIYRLRGRGIPAPRAAVQGARQVAGAIVSSTPDHGLRVPAYGVYHRHGAGAAFRYGMDHHVQPAGIPHCGPYRGALRRFHRTAQAKKEIKHPWFDRFPERVRKALALLLKAQGHPLTLAIVLLAVSVWRIATMGVMLIPDMGSNQLSITVTVPADTEKEDAFATADAVMDAITNIDGVETVGAMSGGSDSTSSMLMMTGTEGTTDNTSFTYYVLLTDEGASNSKAIQQQIADDTADLNCEVDISASSMDMSALSGSGVEVDIYGQNLDSLTTASQQVMDLLNSVDGIENVSNGQETGDEEVHIVIDKDKAMRLGLTVAQVYQQIAAKLSTDTTATTLKVGRDTYDVTIVDKTDTPNLDDLFQMEFITTTTDDDGNTVNETHTLGEFASRTNGNAYATIARENGSRKISVTSDTAEGYNTTLISRDLSPSWKHWTCQMAAPLKLPVKPPR